MFKRITGIALLLFGSAAAGLIIAAMMIRMLVIVCSVLFASFANVIGMLIRP